MLGWLWLIIEEDNMDNNTHTLNDLYIVATIYNNDEGYGLNIPCGIEKGKNKYFRGLDSNTVSDLYPDVKEMSGNDTHVTVVKGYDNAVKWSDLLNKMQYDTLNNPYVVKPLKLLESKNVDTVKQITIYRLTLRATHKIVGDNSYTLLLDDMGEPKTYTTWVFEEEYPKRYYYKEFENTFVICSTISPQDCIDYVQEVVDTEYIAKGMKIYSCEGCKLKDNLENNIQNTSVDSTTCKNSGDITLPETFLSSPISKYHLNLINRIIVASILEIEEDEDEIKLTPACLTRTLNTLSEAFSTFQSDNLPTARINLSKEHLIISWIIKFATILSCKDTPNNPSDTLSKEVRLLVPKQMNKPITVYCELITTKGRDYSYGPEYITSGHDLVEYLEWFIKNV